MRRSAVVELCERGNGKRRHRAWPKPVSYRASKYRLRRHAAQHRQICSLASRLSTIRRHTTRRLRCAMGSRGNYSKGGEPGLDTLSLLVSPLRRNSAMRRNSECGGTAAKIPPSDAQDSTHDILRETPASRGGIYREVHSSAVYPRFGSRCSQPVGMGVEPTPGYKTGASTAVRGPKDVS